MLTKGYEGDVSVASYLRLKYGMSVQNAVHGMLHTSGVHRRSGMHDCMIDSRVLINPTLRRY